MRCRIWLIIFLILVIVPSSFADSSVNFTTLTPFSGTLVHSPDLLINISSEDVLNVTLLLFNSTMAEIRRDNASESPYLFNFSGLSSGVYFFNATGHNSTADNWTETRNVVMLNPTKVSDGSVKSEFKINISNFGDGNELSGDAFGNDVAPLGDLNGDGIPDIVIAEAGNDDGGASNGAVYISFLNESGYVTSFFKINESRLGEGDLLDNDSWGSGVALLGDVDGDGVQDIAVGENGNDDGGTFNGAAWIVFLNTTGGVKNHFKINHSELQSGLSGDEFGLTLAGIGDLNLDGVPDLAVCDPERDDGGTDQGAVFILFLNTTGGVIDEYLINESRFGNGNELSPSDIFCSSVEAIGDINDDGVQDIAVGASKMDDGGTNNGAVFILFLNTSGGVIDTYKINESNLGNGDELSSGLFGYSLAPLGDINNDGVEDIAVGEIQNSDGGTNNGAVWILMLNTSGAPIDHFKINESAFGSGDELDGDVFGSGVNIVGDLDLDGIVDIAVGERLNDDGGSSNGAVWILYLGEDIPIVNIDVPSNGTVTVDTNVDVNYSISDDNIDSCWTTNGSLTDNETLGGCANITSTIWPEGEHRVYVYANNTGGGIGSDSVTFAIDLTEPSWEANSSNLTSSTGADEAISFNITLNDTHPGQFIFSWSNTTTWLNDSAQTYVNGEVISVDKNLSVGSGTISWLWYFNDSVDNLNQTDTFTFVLAQSVASSDSSSAESSGGSSVQTGTGGSSYPIISGVTTKIVLTESHEYKGKAGDKFIVTYAEDEHTFTIVGAFKDAIVFKYGFTSFRLSDAFSIDLDGDGVDDVTFFRKGTDSFTIEKVKSLGHEFQENILSTEEVDDISQVIRLEEKSSRSYLWLIILISIGVFVIIVRMKKR